MEVLTNKSYHETTGSGLSRYTPFPFYYHRIDDKYVGGTTAYLKNTTVYSLHTVSRGETFDTLALDYYNNPTLYWVICSFNRIQDPFRELQEGEKIKIPSLSSIEFDI